MSIKNYNNTKKLIKNRYVILLIAAILQTSLAALNMYLISNEKYVHATINGFFILFIWSYNVKKIVFGNLVDRLLYSVGGALGTGLGILIGLKLYE